MSATIASVFAIANRPEHVLTINASCPILDFHIQTAKSSLPGATEVAGQENAGLENDGQKCMAGKCRTGK